MSVNLSINGQSDQIPPGFRFHPTEEELLHYYLRKKVADEKIDLDVIRDVDLNKLEPWDIQEECKMGSAPQSDWYFFSHKDKKYPTGTRTNRATATGFWKATGRDKIIYNGFSRIGLRKTLVFYEGRAPRGRKSDWIMHEYRLDDGDDAVITVLSEDGWVVCRVFKKKSCRKSEDGRGNFSPSSIVSSNEDGFLDQILSCIGKTCKVENEQLNAGSISTISSLFDEKFIHLPWLESPTILSSLHLPIPPSAVSGYNHTTLDDILGEPDPSDQSAYGSNKRAGWVALDRLVASPLNGQDEAAQPSDHDLLTSRSTVFSRNDSDRWGFTKSPTSNSPDPLGHFSVQLSFWSESMISDKFYP